MTKKCKVIWQEFDLSLYGIQNETCPVCGKPLELHKIRVKLEISDIEIVCPAKEGANASMRAKKEGLQKVSKDTGHFD